MSITQERLLDLSTKYLNWRDTVTIQNYIDGNSFEGAKIYLMSKVDLLWENGFLFFEEAQSIYKEIDIDPGEASRLRQNYALKHEFIIYNIKKPPSLL